MNRRRAAVLAAAALLVAVGCVLVVRATSSTVALADSASTTAATAKLCQLQTAEVAGGTYIVQNNEWGSGASECVTTDGGTGFTVANSSISNATNGAPGGYASIYQGCHWGNCSSGGLTNKPLQASSLTPGAVTTSWSTAQPGGSGAYDVAYDIWFNQTPTAVGQPDGTELMVWLNHNGAVQPFGSKVASNVAIGGHTYDIWEGTQSTWNTVTYDMTTAATSVSDLDVGTLTQDMVKRGYTKSSWYLIDVEAGFELWEGGAGLATKSFSVDIGGKPPTPAAGTAPAPPSNSTPAASAPAGSGSPAAAPAGSATCSVTYKVDTSWDEGFEGQLEVTNTGAATLNSWQLTWALAGGQRIDELWNGAFTQSGAAVNVTSLEYDADLDPGETATLGFIALGTSGNTALTGLACAAT